MSAGDDTFFHKYHISYRIHLRHLLQAAVASEEEGHPFYQKLSKKVEDPKVRDLCRHLAEEEIKHKKLFLSVLNRWLSRPADKKSLSNLLRDLKTQGLFLNPPSPDVTEKEMVLYAVKQEETTADFYLSLEKAFPEAWKRMKVQNLAAEEKAHAQKLIDAFPPYFKDRSPGS
jgi:rubrerythrin